VVFCNFCHQFSEQDYKCPNCNKVLPEGTKRTCAIKPEWGGMRCDRCGYNIPYNARMWLVNTNYYHIDCYEKKNLFSTPKIHDGKSPNTLGDGITVTSDSIPGIDWPTADILDRTFENLQKNASNEELKGFNVVHGGIMDLPLSSPGAFARVYKVQKDKNFVALRFFTTNKGGLKSRYKILGDYFKKNIRGNDKPSCIMDFKYLTNAVKISIKKNNVLFDLIKMDWIDGKTLEYFMITCKNKNEIKIIKEKFKKTIEDMEQYGIAHGDLHPKNIMIDKNSEIKLVDYDCMYVEDFKGSSMPELGDLDTQHPNRASFKYDSTIDRFSALVLYLALMVIEEDPNFSNIRNGDFIFKKEDYEDPHNSNTFKKLKMLSEDVNYILKILISYCEQKNPKIDTLSSILEKA
jgi:hypothetical protein